MQHDAWADQIIELADAAMSLDSMAKVTAARNAMQARQWLLSKLRPEEYGDRMQLIGAGSSSATINVYLPSKSSESDRAHVLEGAAVELVEDGSGES
jgi:hypothetical protein